jgi:hypothetical protein
MRWKIIVVNAVIILLVAALSCVLVYSALTKAVADPAQRKQELSQALRAANAQLALDALRLERWLDERVPTEAVRGVFARGAVKARQQSATAEANRLRDAAVAEPVFAKMTPALVLFVNQQGVSLGRNGSAQMRGERMADAYPSLASALRTGATMSDVWVNRQRQEYMLVSYAPVRGDDGTVVGAVVVGTPLSHDRMARTSELTSGHLLLVGIMEDARVDVIADSGNVPGPVLDATTSQAQEVAEPAHRTGSVAISGRTVARHYVGAAPLVGYGDGRRAVVVAAVPASVVGNVMGILWPILGSGLLGLLLVGIAGHLLGNYVSRPVSEIEEGLLAIASGRTEHRFEIEHDVLGGLVSNLNSLLNALMGVAEDTTDDQGRPSRAPSAGAFREALAVDESSVSGQALDPALVTALAAEPAEQYYRRLFCEYVAAKQQLGDPVDHITHSAFVERIRVNEEELARKHGHPVRYKVELRGNSVVLIVVPLPG